MDKKRLIRGLSILRNILWVILVVEIVLWITRVSNPTGIIPSVMVVVSIVKAWADKEA